MWIQLRLLNAIYTEVNIYPTTKNGLWSEGVCWYVVRFEQKFLSGSGSRTKEQPTSSHVYVLSVEWEIRFVYA